MPVKRRYVKWTKLDQIKFNDMMEHEVPLREISRRMDRSISYVHWRAELYKKISSSLEENKYEMHFYDRLPKYGPLKRMINFFKYSRLSEEEKKELFVEKMIELADYMHVTYNRLSFQHGWSVNPSCLVDFKNLPEENQKLMLDVAMNLLERMGKINDHQYVFK